MRMPGLVVMNCKASWSARERDTGGVCVEEVEAALRGIIRSLFWWIQTWIPSECLHSAEQ